MGKSFKYVPDGQVLTDFFWDRQPVAIIQGPVGSGTSTACCHRIWRQSCEQRADALGVRRSRWYVVRNTFNDLKQTTLKTWKYWFEEMAQGAFGEVKMTNPPEHFIKWNLPDGTTVDLEVIFIALDQEEDVRKLLSAEMTGVWFNEVQFAEKVIFDAARGRAMQGRYPPKLSGGPTWKGVIADLNAPPEGHFIPYVRGDIPLPEEWDDDQRMEYQRPETWSFYVQPAGLIEVIKDGRVVDYLENNRENRVKTGQMDVEAVAENMKWIDVPYKELIRNQSKMYIDTFVMNRVGRYQSGNPVYQGFQSDIHVAKEPIEYNPLMPLVVGIDFARYPAMVATQMIRGQMVVLGEYGVENEAATTYAPMFKKWLARKFPLAMSGQGAGVQFFGDPTGNSKSQNSDKTAYQIFNANGMPVVAAPGNNNITLRIEAVQSLLNKMVDGRPGVLVQDNAITIKSGFTGGYHYSKIRGTNAYQDVPNKRVREADFHDALQYAALGHGVGLVVVTGGQKKAPSRPTKKRYSLKNRRRG